MRRILLVDDDAPQLDIRKLILEREGFEVAAAANPHDAIARAREFDPAFVVMDLRLPEAAGGLALIRALQGRRVIVLSGYPADLEGTPEASMVERILTKPFQSAELVRILGDS